MTTTHAPASTGTPTGTTTATTTAETTEAVRRLLHAYASAVDSQDRALLAPLFAEDAVLHRVGREDITGREAVTAFYGTVFDGPITWSTHLVSNVVADRSGDEVVATASFHAVQVTADTHTDLFGSYRHRLAEAGGTFTIVEKWIHVQHVLARPLGGS